MFFEQEKFKREFRECAHCRRCQGRCFLGGGDGGGGGGGGMEGDSPTMFMRGFNNTGAQQHTHSCHHHCRGRLQSAPSVADSQVRIATYIKQFVNFIPVFSH